MISNNAPFIGINTFCNAPLGDINNYSPTANNPIGIVGIPYDTNVTYRPGARFAPNAIRMASKMLCEEFDNIIDFGDINVALKDTDSMYAMISTTLDMMLRKGIYPIFMGGDHSVTLGILRGLHSSIGKVRLIHLDAHTDNHKDNWGTKYTHGTWFYHALKENLIFEEESISIGIRSPMSNVKNNYKGKIITADNILFDEISINDIVTFIKSSHLPTYLTVDVDVLDPCYPGTGTPEIGGILPHWIKKFFHHLSGIDIDWKGMDLVEVNPLFDVSDITALAGATFIYWHIKSLFQTA